ncbi:unnamed protein product [Parascedosporium putredinis]|uniref:Uncharacterized protein n=1 Tax=Parascedosporium putredinis TaxID=1442378 RepID=A0A9P1M737_9PEZI|nr:unnamed protein product [Parascedosporium putredinis]CAI7987283.1 unnamed protein product [Parascedosporium putredinis]
MASVSPTSASTSMPINGSASPRQSATPKNVAFELLFTDSPQYRARLPMRVQIYPHDTTDSIVTTVKNFYGLYSSPTSSKGVSFEDEQGNTLIARHENFRNNMIVYVRVIEEPAQPSAPPSASFGTAPYQPAPSGNASGRRSASASANPIAGKPARPRPSKSRNAGSQNGADGYDSPTGYSSGDGAPGSSSGKAKDQIGNTEISVENIVEGGRRKRAKFESSELPLFAPRKCQRQPLTHPYRRRGDLINTALLFHMPRAPRTLSLTHELYNLPKVILAAMAKPYIPLPMGTVLAVA